MAKKKRDDFLRNFLGSGDIDPDKLSKHVIHHDKWDQEDYNALLEEMRELAAAEDRLTDVVETGGSAFADTFFGLLKARVDLLDPKEVRPSHLINRFVMGEATELKEFDEMRTYSTGDPIGAALATVAMEPELEVLFDKLKEQQKLADQLQKQMQKMQQMQQESHNLEQMIQQAQGNCETCDGEGCENCQGQAQNFQEQQSLIEQAMQQLQAEIDATSAELAEQLGMQQGMIQAMMKAALKEGIKDAEEMENSAQAWGLEPGVLQRMDAKERIEMAKRLNTEKFKKIAQIFGPMHRMAFAEQQRKTIHSRDEVFNVEMGNDIGRILPMELMKITHPILKKDFYRKFYEGELLQYELRGTEKLAKGGIIACDDGSGSMYGEPEIWAKAVGLSLLQIAKSQNRPFYGIHFGSPNQMAQFDFRDTKKITLEGVIDYAEFFFGGGTDFMTPLSRALDILKEEHQAKGAVKGDIVFITDGMCGVHDGWLEEFKKEQERLGFKVYGVIIGGHVDSEPLKTICDGRVFTIQNLLRGDDIREIFRNV